MFDKKQITKFHTVGKSLHMAVATWGPFYWHGLTLMPTWISNYTHYKVWDEITYPFLNWSFGMDK